MPGTSRENTAWMEEVISRTPRSNFLNTAVRWMYSQTIFLSTFDRFALILQAEEIVDVINDLQQAIVSQQSRPLYPLYIICIDIIIRSVYHDVPCYNALQYTAMFVKDPAEKEEKMGDVTSKALPQGLLRWWRRWGREITRFFMMASSSSSLSSTPSPWRFSPPGLRRCSLPEGASSLQGMPSLGT